MSLPTAMITTTTNSYGTNYCVNCADDSSAIREKVEVALRQGKLIIDEPAGGEVCEGCGRLIRQVPAYERTYLLHPKLEITTTLEIPAHSAIEALWLLDEAIDKEAILQHIQEQMEDLLEGGKMTSPEITYTVDEPKINPPPDFRSLAPSLGLVPTVSPRQTSRKKAYPSLARVGTLIALYGETELRAAYPSNQAACALLHFILTYYGLHPIFFQGYLIHRRKGGRASPHAWLEIQTQVGPRLIDYGARQMWDDETLPSGLFTLRDYPQLDYRGNRMLLPPMPESLQKEVLAVIEHVHAEHEAHPEGKDE